MTRKHRLAAVTLASLLAFASSPVPRGRSFATWEYSHVARAVFAMLSLLCLSIAVTA